MTVTRAMSDRRCSMPTMPRRKGSAAATKVTPRSADELFGLARIAHHPSLSPSDRARVRQLLAGPISELRVDVELAEVALNGPDPEFAAYRLLRALRVLDRSLVRAERGLARIAPTKP